MRIPVGRIYRAFPELDRFTDAQGEQFVRAACKRGWRRHVHRVLILLFLLIAWIIAWLLLMLGAYLLDRFAPTLHRSNAAFWTLGTLSILLFAAPIALTLPVKDWFLLRRLRLVIRARGTCPACQYSLLGAMVDDRDIVVCPECGMGLEADASLNEISTDDAGRRQFMPSGVHKSLEFWTPRRRRIGKRLAIAAAVLVFVVLPASWGGYELFLRRQAATAAAERPGAEGILAFVEAAQPVGSSEEENGWTVMEDVAAAIDSVEYDVLDRVADEATGSAYPDYSSIYGGISEHLEGERLLEAQLSQQLAYASLDEMRNTGVLDELDRLATLRRAVHEFSLPANQPAVFVLLPTLGSARNLARLSAARMYLAAEAGDREEFLAAFESGLAVARFCAHQFTLIEALVGDAIVSLMHDRARAAILQHPDAEWLDGIEAAIARQAPPLPPSHRFTGEVYMGLDTINWFFADPSRVRFGRFSPHVTSLFGGFTPISPLQGRLGTYADNRDTYKSIFEPYIQAAGIDAFARPAPPPHETGGLLLVDNLAPALHRTLEAMDRLTASTRATTIMIALERHYLAHGAYPESLDALVPAYLTALPLDP
ncbi:MAG: hypothetical protein ACF8LK_05600, partial [Phycisphaerales bacterium JB041]